MSNDMQIAREEIFGPVAGVVRVKNYEEALSVANDTPFGLSAGICTSSLNMPLIFKRNAEAGVLMVNLPTAGIDSTCRSAAERLQASALGNRGDTPPNSTRQSVSQVDDAQNEQTR
ncbi:MAG TPA: aldehyde dehydrogenase family protein [Rhizobiaceae bacterium]|nr:aldehyde dehydrogenase family protein [Rhizobiaceae bacterium]